MVSTHTFTVFKGDETGKIHRATTTRKLNPDEVLVKITYSGLCGTDCHYRPSGCVLGHEGIGVVEELGENAHRFKKGDVVGWGYIHKTCGICLNCLKGQEVYCVAREFFGTHDLDQGSMGTHAIWREAYLFAIPKEIEPAKAAPLMCAGATVFAPLYENNVNATHTVGIVGIGGLGHLAIQFAAKMGCRVVVFSSSEDKRAEALQLGASEFYSTKGKTKLEVAHKIDYLLVATSYLPSWELYLDVMNALGSVFPLTIDPVGLMQIPYPPFLTNGLKIVGTIIASRGVHTIMLEFAARHKVQAMIEVFPMNEEGITEAFAKLDAGKLRYRAVLQNQM
ncbi:alcohol dehydrogenase [Sphaerosporella brunnea]|uniref:Alcohol dehydrogenase n=1 Tax=Sphaerosporella brunnea TaxID=1250544 RepID=A0A5J5FC85_9PEZI|nr:alcohol dehydrogenase [Sphaerosporella brunnea]